MIFFVSHFLLLACAGVLYRDAGDITLAIEAYEQCLKIDPDSRNAGQVFNLLVATFLSCEYLGYISETFF